MNIEKAHWETDGDKVRLNMSFSKVDKENRMVYGFASADNIDRQGDLVPSETSMKAFNSFRGNLREMHQPIAAGKVVSFSQQDLYDPETEKMYSGTYVGAYVSKGAQDTWEKVLDGTLTGFSIGGSIKDAQNVYNPATKSMNRVIKDMDLFELSLVDNPANPLANFTSVLKIDDGKIVKGIAVDVTTENWFWCDSDQFAQASQDEEISCVKCGDKMQNIGWVETGGDTTQKVASLVDTHINSTQKRNEGGIDMSGNEVAAVVDETAGTTVAEATATLDWAAALDELKSFVTKSIEDAITAQNATIEEVSKSWQEQNLTLEGKVAEVTAWFTAAKNGVPGASQTITGEPGANLGGEVQVDGAAANPTTGGQAVSGRAAANVGPEFTADNAAHDPTASANDTVAGRPAAYLGPEVDVHKALVALTEQVEALSKSAAFKKSGDLGGEPEKQVQKSLWKGSFLGADAIA